MIAVAASLLVAILGLSWAIWADRQEQQAHREVALLQGDLSQLRMELGVERKERLLRELPSRTSEMWGGETSGKTLQQQVPTVRGDPRITDEAMREARTAQTPFQKVVASGGESGKAELELAAVEIAVRRLDVAAGHLERAGQILGDDPAVENMRAIWLIAHFDRDSEDEAERLLRRLTKDHPDFLPGWFNLALLLQRTDQLEESETMWQAFLEREDRPAYRKAAELHLDKVLSSSEVLQ